MRGSSHLQIFAQGTSKVNTKIAKSAAHEIMNCDSRTFWVMTLTLTFEFLPRSQLLDTVAMKAIHLGFNYP